MKKLSTSFAKNRTEELPDDLWERYVLPLNYEDNNLLGFSKSTIVVGGRGSGKTMYLKYHCYPTIFSTKKKILTDEECSNIGIYWRPDTDFAHMITKEYLDTKWKAAFEAYIGLSIFSEFSKLVSAFIASNYDSNSEQEKAHQLLIPEKLATLFHCSPETKVTELNRVCQELRSQLNDWLNYPEGRPPIVFGAKEKWLYFIDFTMKQLTSFQKTTFHLFIDEFENLPEEQQVLINTWIKHSQHPLIFHIAFKKHCKVTSNTQGNEQIVDVNDYRILDLEMIYERHFDTLAAEIIHSKINYFFNHSNNNYDLSDIHSLTERNNVPYQKEIKQKVEKIFPTPSIIETVDELFKDQALITKLEKLIKEGLETKGSKLDYKLFINNNFKRESIINGILLHRKNITPEKLLESFNTNNQRFYGPLINNNLLGGILYLYNTYQNKTCPYYAGFERFISLSQSNIRHLLELCYQSIIEYEMENPTKDIDKETFYIPSQLQANAAKRTSKMQIDKLSGLGKYGRDLQKIAIRLGKIFLLSQKRKSQSIAEITQFSLKNYQLVENEDITADMLITESKIWGILKEETNNKITTAKDNSTEMYILHPIFSPHFGISPRRKRKLDLTYDQFKTIFLSNETTYQVLYEDYAKEWKIEDDNNTSLSYNTNSLLDFI